MDGRIEVVGKWLSMGCKVGRLVEGGGQGKKGGGEGEGGLEGSRVLGGLSSSGKIQAISIPVKCKISSTHTPSV